MKKLAVVFMVASSAFAKGRSVQRPQVPLNIVSQVVGIAPPLAPTSGFPVTELRALNPSGHYTVIITTAPASAPWSDGDWLALQRYSNGEFLVPIYSVTASNDCRITTLSIPAKPDQTVQYDLNLDAVTGAHVMFESWPGYSITLEGAKFPLTIGFWDESVRRMTAADHNGSGLTDNCN